MKVLCAIILSFSLFGCLNSLTSKAKRNKYKLFLCLGSEEVAQTLLNKSANVYSIHLLNINTLDITGSSNLNYAKIADYVNQTIPERKAKGYCVLEWEGVVYSNLINYKKGESKFEESLLAFQTVLNIVKSMRPNLKVGYYNLPPREYWNRDAAWREKNRNILQLLSLTDVIFPDIYDFYADNTPSAGARSDENYVKDNILNALKIAKELNKEVYPFVWYRWHDSNQTDGLYLIPITEFSNHLSTALSVSYLGKTIDGFVWWGSDQYYYNIKTKPLIEESRLYRNFDDYQKRITRTYFNEIMKVFEKNGLTKQD